MKWGKVPNFGKDKGKGEERKGKRMTEKGERECLEVGRII